MNHVDQDHMLSKIAKDIMGGGGESANVAMLLRLHCIGINFSKTTPLRTRVVAGATKRREATYIMLIVAVVSMKDEDEWRWRHHQC